MKTLHNFTIRYEVRKLIILSIYEFVLFVTYKYYIINIFNLEDIHKENVKPVYNGIRDGGMIQIIQCLHQYPISQRLQCTNWTAALCHLVHWNYFVSKCRF